ncbi:MAG: glycosyltransferase [Myxococcota bacterium]
MRIAVLGYGTRGDTQPFVVLARALRKAGHEAWVGAPENHQAFVEKSRVPFRPLFGDAQEFLHSEQGQKWLASGNVRELLAGVTDYMHQHRDAILDAVAAACAGADAVVAQVLISGQAGAVAEKHGQRMVLASTFPMTPTGAFASPFLRRDFRWRVLNRWSHQLVEKLAWMSQQPDVQHARQRLGLPRLRRPHWRHLMDRGVEGVHLYSPLMLGGTPDWETKEHLTGVLVPDEEMRAGLGEGGLSAELERFLSDGAPPVFLGFGSMPVLDPTAMLTAVHAVARSQGVRFVVGAGWSRLDAALGSSNVLVVERANHDALFPRCAAVVHHGGMGTTAAALRAGVPSAVLSVFGDQPFWGRRLVAMGVGVHHPFTALDPALLERVVTALHAPPMRERARALGQRLAAERGAERAAQLVGEILERTPPLCA